MDQEYTTITLPKETKEKLKQRKAKGQSYNGLIQELLEETEGEK